jgi:response regulator RpfG family c-di-GMP phosphodiesterase
MTQLLPHLLLRSDAASSEIAVALRDAGYHVTKAKDDDTAVRTLGAMPVDAVIVELPVVTAVGFLHRLEIAKATTPVLALTRSPEVLRRSIQWVETYDVRDGLDHLTSATDLLLVRSELRKVS